jgi:DNA primase
MPLDEWLVDHALTMPFLEEHGVSYDTLRSRLVIPVRSVGDRFCFDLYRNFDERFPPYEFSVRQCRPHSTLYGLKYSLKDVQECGYVVVVEGFSDCLSLRANGVPNVCATMTASLSSTIIVLGDDDPAGRKFAESSENFSLTISEHDPSSAIAAGIDVARIIRELIE